MSPLRILALLVAPVLIYFSWLQLNDPAPLRWILIYGLSGIVMIITIFRVLPAIIYLVVGMITLLSFFVLLPWVIREAAFSGTEIERELLGMLLLTVIMVIFWAGFRLESRETTE